MLLKDAIRVAKKNVAEAVWSQDKPQRRDFPLSCVARGCFPITKKWRWSVIEFEAEGAHFRLMIAYHVEVPKFQMVLGEVMKNDTKVLIRVEYDVAHSPFGWHVHTLCEDSSSISSGMIKPLGQKRIPAAKTKHRRSEYTLSGDSMNDIIALDVAAKWFNFRYQPSLGFH
jgi:hypothetical protein